jgi:acetyl/propionyl-CoA carboxylase alpha subunit
MSSSYIIKNNQTINDFTDKRKLEHGQKLRSANRHGGLNRAELRRKSNHTDLKQIAESQKKSTTRPVVISDLKRRPESAISVATSRHNFNRAVSSAFNKASVPISFVGVQTVKKAPKQNLESSEGFSEAKQATIAKRDLEAEIDELTAGVEISDDNKVKISKIVLILTAAITACCLLALATSVSVNKMDNVQNNNGLIRY